MQNRRQQNRKKAALVAPEPSWFEQHYHFLFYAVVVLSGVLYLCLDPQYKTGIYNDDALYVITAHDFWDTRTTHPLLEIKPDFPLPGLPLFLKLVVNITGHMSRTSILASVLSVLILGIFARRWLTMGQTLAVMTLYAFNPLVARFSGIVMPDPFFRLMIVSSFLLMDKSLRLPTPAKTLGLGVILGWGTLIRPEGVVLLFSVVMGLLLVRKGRQIIPLMSVPLLAWAIFLYMWFKVRSSGSTEYGPDLIALLSYWRHNMWEAVKFPFAWFQSFIGTSWNILLNLPTASFHYVSLTLFVLFLVGVVIGIRFLWKRVGVQRPVLISAVLLCLSFSAVHIFWHVPDARYFITLIPFSTICLTVAMSRGPWGKILLCGVLLFCANENTHAIYQSLLAPNPMNAPPRKNIDWIKDNTKPTAKFISNIAPTIDLYTKRPTSSLFNATNVDMLQYLLLSRQFEYIVLRAGTATDSGAVSADNVNAVWDRYRRWMLHYTNRFPCVFSEPTEATGTYGITSQPSFVGAYRKYIAASQAAEAKQYQQAFEQIRECLMIDPDLGSATNLLGALYFLANDYKMAEQMFLKTFELLPDSPNALINLASVYNRQGKPELAAQFINRGLTVNQMNGDSAEFKAKVGNLQKLWLKNDCELFIDFPHPSLYAEVTE